MPTFIGHNDLELFRAIPLPDSDSDLDLSLPFEPEIIDDVNHAAKYSLPDDNHEDFPEASLQSAKVPDKTPSTGDLRAENPAFGNPQTDICDKCGIPQPEGTMPLTSALANSNQDIGAGVSVDEVDIAAATPLPADELKQTMWFERMAGQTSFEELKTIFIDVVTCHHLAYAREGTLYGSFTPNQVMFMRNKKTRQVSGMLVDCDPLLSNEPVLRNYRRWTELRSDTFMSLDIADEHCLNTDPPAFYRHDFQSIIKVFSRLSRGVDGGMGGVEFELWLYQLLADERSQIAPTEGRITFTLETFLKAMGVPLPDTHCDVKAKMSSAAEPSLEVGEVINLLPISSSGDVLTEELVERPRVDDGDDQVIYLLRQRTRGGLCSPGLVGTMPTFMGHNDLELFKAMAIPLPDSDKDLDLSLPFELEIVDDVYHAAAVKNSLPDDNHEASLQSAKVPGKTPSAGNLENPVFCNPQTDISNKYDIPQPDMSSSSALAYSSQDISVRVSVDEVDLAAATPLPADELEQTMLFERMAGLTSLKEFKTIFIDIVTCHHLAYAREGTIYGYLTPNQVMFMRNKKTRQVSGMLVDCDPLLSDEPVLRNYRRWTELGSDKFIAIDRLIASKRLVDLNTPILYRHDLESILYIFLWIMGRFDLWDDPTGLTVGDRNMMEWPACKEHVVFEYDKWFSIMREPAGLGSPKAWLRPMITMLADEHEQPRAAPIEEGTTFTFEAFMKAMGVCLLDTHRDTKAKMSSAAQPSSEDREVSDPFIAHTPTSSCGDVLMEEPVKEKE